MNGIKLVKQNTQFQIFSDILLLWRDSCSRKDQPSNS